MFGNRFFGARYFGDRYFGEGAASGPAAPATGGYRLRRFSRSNT